jgi:hypothetical protein
LVGAQVARILVERGEKPVLMDNAAQNKATITLPHHEVRCAPQQNSLIRVEGSRGRAAMHFRCSPKS